MSWRVHQDRPGQRVLLLGNEAVARGAVEAGLRVAAAYPGTPSSEIIETLARGASELGLYVEWSTNEKVAFEVALAASLCHQPAMVAMKHVGLNVAHDPFAVAAYMGARGPLLTVVADDPGAHSSQSEQDSRYIAEQCYWPVLEPSSVAEAKAMTVAGFELSARFGHPFLLRSVTRVSHGRGDVELGPLPTAAPPARFEPDPERLVYTPRQARHNRPLMLERFEQIRQATDDLPFNQLRLQPGARLGLIASGLAHGYALEALRWMGLSDRVSVLKIGTPHPLPTRLVVELLRAVDQVLVVEELEPFVEQHVKALAAERRVLVDIHGKDLVPICGELSTRLVVEALAELCQEPLPVDFAALDATAAELAPLVPERPPSLCAGCPHRAAQHAMRVAAKRVARDRGKQARPLLAGDIGCYTLSYLPPLESMDTTVCMGASYGMACGFAQVLSDPVVAQLGDSTFFHSGIPALVNAVYNRADVTMVVLDNAATAMTGYQPHPGTGRTATGVPTVQIRPEDVARACQVQFVEVVDPLDRAAAIEVFERAMRFDGPALVVARRPCRRIEQRELKERGQVPAVWRIDPEACDDCSACVEVLGCPALVQEQDTVVIDERLCGGCGLCAQLCPHQAIQEG